MYRPGPYLALAIMLLPVVITVAGALVAFNGSGAVPVWLPFVLLLWLPCLPLIWRTMLTVRTDMIGIAAGRPWQRWREIPWAAIERVERRGMTIHIHASQGDQIALQPFLLQNGSELTRDLLLRVPAHTVAGSLSQEAQGLLVTGVFAMPEGGLSGTLYARPRLLWRVICLLISAAGIALSAAALLTLAIPLAIPVVVLGAIVTAGALAVFVWLAQALRVDGEGLSVIWSIRAQTRGMKWSEIALVEHSRGEAQLRLHGGERILCAGPGLFKPAQRDLMRAFLNEYCVGRRVPVVRRGWVLR